MGQYLQYSCKANQYNNVRVDYNHGTCNLSGIIMAPFMCSHNVTYADEAEPDREGPSAVEVAGGTLFSGYVR
jgi:hypothetical protein